jgi:hypothetical protein
MSFEIEEIVYVKINEKWYSGEVLEVGEDGVEIFINDKNTSYKITDMNNIKKIPENYQDFKITGSLSNFYNTNLDFTDIDEKVVLDKKCFDIISQEDLENKDYLDEDETENILLIKKVGDKFLVDCFKREYIKDILKDKTKARLFCELFNRNSGRKLENSVLNVEGFVDLKYKFYKLDTTFGSFYISEISMKEMLNTGNRIFYVKPLKVAHLPRTASLSVAEGGSVVSGNHCQKGTGIDIYEIAICGGANCLPKVIIDRYLEEKDDEEDNNDEEDWDPEFDYDHNQEFENWYYSLPE